MKFIVRNICFLFLVLQACGMAQLSYAQQRPIYTQFNLNPFITNPSVAGIEDHWEVKMSYRNQWVNLDGGPQSIYVTAHGPIKKQSRLQRAAKSATDKSGSKTQRGHLLSTIPHGGLGFTVLSDRAGPVDWYGANAAYAYHVPVSSKASLSAGISTGVQGIFIHTNELNFGTVNPNDPAVVSTTLVNTIKPDISLGIWFYTSSYFIGIASQHIIPQATKYSDLDTHNTEGRLVPHSSLITGYKFPLHVDVYFVPSVMVRYIQNAPLSFDVNLKFQYQNMAWVGASYRYSNSLAGMLGINVTNSLSFSYSYDMTNSSLGNSSNGTHEVVVGILLGHRKRVVLSPRDFW